MHNKLVLVLALLGTLLLAACEEDLTADDYRVKAAALSQSGDLRGALIELKNAAQIAPFNMQVRRDMAYVYLDMGLGAEAEKEARRAREMGLPDSEAAVLLARALILQAKFDELVEEADEFAAESTPEAHGEILAWRGVALIELEDFELAARTLQEALKLDPDSALALSAQASLEARTGNLETAKQLIEQALQADPDTPEALALKGDILAAEGDIDAAREAYTRAVESRGYPTLVNARRGMLALRQEDLPAAQLDVAALRGAGLGNTAAYHQLRGLLLFLRKDYAAASVELEKGVEAAPKNIPMRVYLAASLLEQERFEQADVVLTRLYGLIPESYDVARLRASLAVQMADVTSAEQTLQEIIAGQEEQDGTMLGMLGALAMVRGDTDEAVKQFERVLAENPEDERAREALREARALRGDFIERDLETARGSVDESQYAEVLMSAASALQKGEPAKAMEMARNLHRQFPDRTDALKVVASAQLTSGDFMAGRATMESILEIDPLEPSTTRNLAKVYEATGDAERAMALLDKYLQARPEDSLARSIKSGLIVSTSDPKTAAARLEEMLQSDPGNHGVRSRLVKLRFDAGQFDQVVVLTENMKKEWIAAQPLLMELRGKAFANLGQADMTFSTWEQWVEAVPDSVLANYYYSDGLASRGQFDAAMRALEKSVELNDNYLPARLAQVRMTALQGDLGEARSLMDGLRAAVKIDRAEVWRMEGWLSVEEGKYDQAEKAFRRALEIEPSAEAALLLAVTLSSDGRQDDALAELETWRRQFPRDLSLLGMLAQGYLQQAPDRARALYEEMLEIAPNSILALNNLAWLERERDPDRALSYARRADELLPGDPVVLDTYGMLLADSGKLDAGVSKLSQAVEAQPDNLQYRLNYGKLLLRQGRQRQAEAELSRVAEGGDAALAKEARALLAPGPDA